MMGDANGGEPPGMGGDDMGDGRVIVRCVITPMADRSG
jgi:hypothetical protein